MLAIRGFYALYDGVPDDGLVWGVSFAHLLFPAEFVLRNNGWIAVGGFSEWAVLDYCLSCGLPLALLSRFIPIRLASIEHQSRVSRA